MSGEHVFVMFYAPWCVHCKHSKPEFEAAGQQTDGVHVVEYEDYMGAPVPESGVILVKVNCDNHGDKAERFEVEGFPTFQLFHNVPNREGFLQDHHEERTHYGGGRTSVDFSLFIKGHIEARQELDYRLYKKYKRKYLELANTDNTLFS